MAVSLLRCLNCNIKYSVLSGEKFKPFMSSTINRLQNIFFNQSFKSLNTLSQNIYSNLTENSVNKNKYFLSVQASTILDQTKRYARAPNGPRFIINFQGKTTNADPVTERFYRLNNGMWIRPRAGRYRHLWRKRSRRKQRLLEHVILTSKQSAKLDKMVTMKYKRNKYFPDNPYQYYHKSFLNSGGKCYKPPFLPLIIEG